MLNMAEENEGGYDVEFVEPLKDDYVCVICLLVLREPIQIESCGHRLCKICYTKICKR